VKREPKKGPNDLKTFFEFKDSNEEEKLKVGFTKLVMEKIRNNDYVSIPNVYQEFTFDSQYQTLILEKLVEQVKIFNNINAPV